MKLHAATATDGYKLSHGAMYADGTTKVYSNLTPRSDKIYRRNCTSFYDGKLVWVGAQGAVQEIKELWDEFFSADKDKVVSRFARRMAGYLGGYDPAVKVLAELHDVGYLPLTFKSLPEGSKVGFGIPVITITNTLPQFYWLVNYLETIISSLTWKTATNATIAAEYRAIVDYYGQKTGTDEFTRSIQCHDFSMRGMSGPEDAARAGFAHLTSFIGTDTLPAMDYAEDYYDADPNSLIAISVPATEHAVATSNILAIESEFQEGNAEDFTTRLDAERLFMHDLITRKFPTGIVSYVADSFDFWAVLTDVLPALKDVIVAREASNVAPAKLVIRPDSGDPIKVITGYKILPKVFQSVTEFYNYYDYNSSRVRDTVGYEVVNIGGQYISFKIIDSNYVLLGELIPAAEVKGAVQVLWETFGGSKTVTGYKLLDSHIGLIYGDSITTQRAEEILRRLADKGFASGNIVFGVGSYTYQCNTRDTFGFAVKATYTEVNGEGLDIFKDPKTDAKKKSAKGLLYVSMDGNREYSLTDSCAIETEECPSNMLQTIFENGEFVKRTSLEEIRQRVATQ